MENKNPNRSNRFQSFFEEHAYVLAKRYIYNYHIRRKAVSRYIDNIQGQLVLETGCGVAPVVPNSSGVVYTDLSFTAVHYLKAERGSACFVVADCTNLPFKPNVFAHTVTSEVLEHIEDDDAALKELSRVMCRKGQLIITVPHKKFYFAFDDRYVAHFRRYEIEEIKTKLLKHGLKTVAIRKVLGPVEKITMWTVTGLISLFQKFSNKMQVKQRHAKATDPALLEITVSIFKWVNKYYAGLARLDAKIMPMALATVLLVKAQTIRLKY